MSMMLDPEKSLCDSEEDYDFSAKDTDTYRDFETAEDASDPVVRAVVENDIKSLRKFSETTELDKFVQPATGDTLLQIAVRYERKAAFDYLLSIGNCPVNHKNATGDSVLSVCWDYPSTAIYDHFACEVVKRGACMYSTSYTEKMLHFAINSSFVNLSKLLMEMGYDVNMLDDDGDSPLWLCIMDSYYERTQKAQTEMATALLCYGADPMQGSHKNYNLFEYAVYDCTYTLQEALFYHMIDDHTSMDVHLEILLTLCDRRSHFFLDTLNHTKDVIVDKTSLRYHHLLFSIDIDYLDALITKCPDAIRAALREVKLLHRGTFYERRFLENLSHLVESDVRDDALFFIADINRHVFYFDFLVKFPVDQPVPLEHLCFLLSYGLELSELHVEDLYRKYGFGELFKILLHTDVTPMFPHPHITSPILQVFFDLNCDLEKILERTDPNIDENLSELMHYFADPKLRALCSDEEIPEDDASVADQPDVPLLGELARNVFRKFFIEAFDIKSAGQFYKLVTKLPVPPEHKKIITFEKRLY